MFPMSAPSDFSAMEKIGQLIAMRRGFIFSNRAKIYGGLNGFVDYGPLALS